SVMRKRVFENNRFQAAYRNEAEDQLFVIRSLKLGHRLAYFDNIHVDYHVHDANSSGSATGGRSLDRQPALLEPVVRGLQDLRADIPLTRPEEQALRRRLNREYFWHIGYSVYRLNRRYPEALAAFRRGLAEWPWSLRCWKTFMVTRARAAFHASE